MQFVCRIEPKNADQHGMQRAGTEDHRLDGNETGKAVAGGALVWLVSVAVALIAAIMSLIVVRHSDVIIADVTFTTVMLAGIGHDRAMHQAHRRKQDDEAQADEFWIPRSHA